MDATRLAEGLDRAAALAHEDPDAAEALALSCSEAAAALDLSDVDARASYLRARLHAERGELRSALALVERARSLWLRAHDPVSALRTDLGRMQILDDLGRHTDAVAVGESLLAALDVLDSMTTVAADSAVRAGMRADALGNVGVAYSFLGEHERSLEAYAASEQLYIALGRTADTAKPLANRGIELLALGRPRDALSALRAAGEAFSSAGDQIWSAKCAGHIGQAHLRMGQLIEALAVLEPAAATLRGLGVTAEWVRIELTIASVHLSAGLHDEAAVAATAVMERTREAGMVHDCGFATLTLALAELGAGRLERAARTLNSARDLFEQVGDRQYAAQVTLASAEVAVRQGSPDAAQAAEAAVSQLRTGGWLIPLARAHLVAADAATDDVTKERNLGAAAPLIEELGLPSLRYEHILRLARLRRGQGAVDASADLLRRAIATAEHMGTALPDPILQTAFRTDKAPAYDELIDLLVDRADANDVAEARAVSDLAKAQTLIDLIGRTTGTSTSGVVVGTEDRDQLELCQVDLSAVYAALADEAESSRRDLLWQHAKELEQRIVGLRTRMSAAAPRSTPDHVPNPELGSHDDPSLPVLRYHVLGADVLAFVSLAGTDRVHRLVGAATAIDAAMDALSAQWQRFRMGPDFVRRNAGMLARTTEDVLRTLYDVLIAPIRPWLDEAEAPDLIVVPHLRLGEVPFHALHDGARHVAQIWATTIRPTTMPARARPTPARTPRAPLVLAVADPHAPAIDGEARSLAETLPGAEIVVGAAATTDRFRSSLAGRSVVHLACHGVYRESNPLFSALRFADRWLTSAEVLDLDLEGTLVVLSACESGRPGHGSAEPVGLTWAFLAAGASGAIASQWLVDDEVAAHFAQLVHGHLAQQRSPAQAVQLAQLAIRESHPHPYHWAPFAFVSSPAPYRTPAPLGNGATP